MWKLIDRVENRVTYASQLGSIGCLVLVVIECDSGYPSEKKDVKSESSAITFVPGISMQPDSFGNIKLEPMAGYGQFPTDLPPDPEDPAYS